MPPPPTLEELQDALIGNKTEQLRVLRAKLKFAEQLTDKVVTEQTSDSGFNRLRLLLENYGPNCLSCKNADGNTLVHLTAKTCESAIALEHIYAAQGGEANLDSLDCFRARGKGDRTAVHYAAKNKNIAVLKWLVTKLDVKCLKVRRADRDTAVHIAARHLGADAIKLIVDQLGASCSQNQLGCDDRQAFHCAAMNVRSNEALRWLIKNVHSENLIAKDGRGDTAVHLAAMKQGEDTMELLKESLGVSMFALVGENEELAVHSAAQNPASSSALAWCVREMGPQCLLMKDQLNRLPIHLAAQYQGDRSMEIVVGALGEECLTTALDDCKRTAVHYAAMNETGNSALRWIVGKLGPQCLKLRDCDDQMPVHMAAWYQGVDSLAFITDCLGAEAFLWPGLNGRRMSHYAAENYNQAELLDWIVKEVGPQCLLVPDADGTTPESIAGLCE